MSIIEICPGPPPLEQIYFVWGTKGKKLPWGHQMEKENFLWGLKEDLISFGPPKEVFSLWYPKVIIHFLEF